LKAEINCINLDNSNEDEDINDFIHSDVIDNKLLKDSGTNILHPEVSNKDFN